MLQGGLAATGAAYVAPQILSTSVAGASSFEMVLIEMPKGGGCITTNLSQGKGFVPPPPKKLADPSICSPLFSPLDVVDSGPLLWGTPESHPTNKRLMDTVTLKGGGKQPQLAKPIGFDGGLSAHFPGGKTATVECGVPNMEIAWVGATFDSTFAVPATVGLFGVGDDSIAGGPWASIGPGGKTATVDAGKDLASILSLILLILVSGSAIDLSLPTKDPIFKDDVFKDDVFKDEP